jgi:hypothetical protein
MREPQLVTLHRPIRGVTRTIIMRPNGQVVMPVRQEHGLATWLLEPGRYIAVTISRPRWLLPYEVIVQCLEVDVGMRSVVWELRFLNVSVTRGKLLEWARECPGELG